ncbi:MAG TPA: sulfite exporter TauE/SafE family protein [Verrucomicrobiae bacterium]
MFLTCALVGLIAQMIDGALGMAYGVSCNTFLLSVGIAPAAAAASVKTAEVFTTGVSGLAHLKLGNVDKKLFHRLVFPGVIGGVLGAYILTNLDGDKIKPYIAIYLLIMGAVIIKKAFKRPVHKEEKHHHVSALGFFGAFMDAIGGGGWGPIVTSTLLAGGREPRTAIGSVNTAEFFVTIAQAATFTAFLGLKHGPVVLGLIIGGVAAAPVAAYVVKHIPAKKLMITVGVLIILLSIRTLLLSFK